MGFAEDIGRFRAKSKMRLGELVTGVCEDIAKEVVQATPANTGRARGNWICQLDGSLPREETGRLDREGAVTLAAIVAVLATFEAGKFQRIWLANTLSYILDLENGSSDKAPHGMMRLTAQKFPEIVRQNLARLRR